MVTLAHAQHISPAYGAKFLSGSRLIHSRKLLQLSLERSCLNHDAFVELHSYTTSVRPAAYFSRKHWRVGTIQLRLDSIIILDSCLLFIYVQQQTSLQFTKRRCIPSHISLLVMVTGLEWRSNSVCNHTSD